jgi:hypothetical protein
MFSTFPIADSPSGLRRIFESIYITKSDMPAKLQRMLEGVPGEYTSMMEFLNDLKKTRVWKKEVALCIQFKYKCNEVFRYDPSCNTSIAAIERKFELNYCGVFNDSAILHLLQQLTTFLLAPYIQSHDTDGKPIILFLYTNNATFVCIDHFHVAINYNI